MAVETKSITFKNGLLDVAGDLRLPDEFDEAGRYAALVVVTPGSSVKEQIGANYGSRMTDRGYVTLVFDPSYQGQSSGEPRDLEDPAARVEDVRCAIDYLTTLPYVDEDRIGILGVCAGGGYTVAASMTEHRIKAVGTVVPVNLGRAFRQGDGTAAPVDTLEAVGKQRTAEARGGEPRRDPWLPDTVEQAKEAGVDIDTMDAVEFYRTPRGFNKYSTNRRFFRSNAAILGFDAFHLAEELLTQPIQIVVGGRIGTTGSFADGHLLWEKCPQKREILVVEGAGHYDMYDKPEYVDRAIECLGKFYDEHLGG